MTPTFFNPRFRSLPRANLIVVISLGIATYLSDFPHLRATPLLVAPALGCLIGMVDTVRCMQRRWSYYHAGVILCLYMDLMAITLTFFFLFYPYFLWFDGTR